MNSGAKINIGTFAVIGLIYLGVIIWLAIVAAKKTKSKADWMLGGAALGPVIIAFTYFATRLSASTYLGEPAWVYTYGWPYHWIGITNAAFWLAATLLLTHKLRTYSVNLNSFTVSEFIGERFQSNSLRVFISLVLVLFYFLVIYSMFKGFVALVSTTLGVSPVLALIIFAVVVLLYVSIGGFRAVAYTDVFQGILMFGLIFILWGIGLHKVGGSYAVLNQKLSAIDPGLVRLAMDKGDFFSPFAVLCLPFYLFISLATNPYCAIRFMALKDTRRKTVFTFISVLITLGLVCFFIYNFGLFGRVLYPGLKDPDSVVPTLIGNLLPAPLNALMIFAILAAIMSTTDSLLHTSATCISEDIYLKSINRNATEKQVNAVSRITVAVLTIGAMVLSFFILPQFLSRVLFIALGGAGILTLGPLLIGIYWERSTKIGAWCSSVSGVVAFAFFRYVVVVNLWQRGVLAGAIAVVVMYAVSLMTKPVPKEVLLKMKGKA